LNRLLATLAGDDVSFAHVAELIEKDTVLAGNVLGVVNSALYGLDGTVNSVRHAVAILGMNKLRNVALSMSVSRMWGQARTPPGWPN
jgi:EAL and modified HD-GYP domain-containing signal transduction protein